MTGGEYPRSLAIVERWQNATCATGEEYYTTEDGRYWRKLRPFEKRDATGATVGRINGDKINVE